MCDATTRWKSLIPCVCGCGPTVGAKVVDTTPDEVAIYRESFCKATHEARQTIPISLRTEP